MQCSQQFTHSKPSKNGAVTPYMTWLLLHLLHLHVWNVGRDNCDLATSVFVFSSLFCWSSLTINMLNTCCHRCFLGESIIILTKNIMENWLSCCHFQEAGGGGWTAVKMLIKRVVVKSTQWFLLCHIYDPDACCGTKLINVQEKNKTGFTSNLHNSLALIFAVPLRGPGSTSLTGYGLVNVTYIG